MKKIRTLFFVLSVLFISIGTIQATKSEFITAPAIGGDGGSTCTGGGPTGN